MTEPVQGIFDFESGCANGYENWRKQQEARLAAIRLEWGLPVGRRVRLCLRNVDNEFEGLLELVEPPAAIDRRFPLFSPIVCVWA